MASLYDLLKQYARLDKGELLRIANNAYCRFDQDHQEAGNDKFIVHMVGYVAYNADIELTRAEYEFFQNVTGYSYKSFDDFKRVFRQNSWHELTGKLFEYMRNNFSMTSKVALLQICLCLCAYDGISPFERGYLQSLFGYDVTDAYDQYAEM
ncbi:MAG: hypothetical protein IKC47_00490 [Clostridia bacterium]|nr:hypothetical protein [Clostridia bacterium]